MSLPSETDRSSVEAAKVWSSSICGTILCLAGLAGIYIGIDHAGWLILIGAMVLL